jgi:NitT/TauT family transport system permease protein
MALQTVETNELPVQAVENRISAAPVVSKIGKMTKKGNLLKPYLEKFNSWSKGLYLVALFFALWELLPRMGIINQVFLPTFSETIKTLIGLFVSGKIFVHIGVSLARALAGFFLAVIFAIPLGFLMGWYNRFEKYTDLFMQTLRNTSTFALFPIFLLLFGLGEASKVAIIFYAATWQLLINTISGVKNIDPLYIKATLPSIVSGARLGIKIAFMTVIAAEMIGAKSGLGFFIQNAQYNFMIPEMYAGVLVLAVIGVVLNYILVWLEKKATSWKGGIDSSIMG